MKTYTDFDFNNDDDIFDNGWIKSYVSTYRKNKKDNTSIEKSKEILVKAMMDKYGITESDLESPEKVKAKIRNGNIDEIIK